MKKMLHLMLKRNSVNVVGVNVKIYRYMKGHTYVCQNCNICSTFLMYLVTFHLPNFVMV